MVLPATQVDLEAFDRFVTQPENADRLFELIAGEIVEVPSNPYVSKLASRIIARLLTHVEAIGDVGHVIGEAGGYMVSGERYAPDVAYISKDRQPKLAERGYNPNPPEFAVEIVSPDDDPKQLMVKVGNYMAAGTWVWVGYPQTKEFAVYISGAPVKLYGLGDTLDLEGLLPGFTITVDYIFKD